MRYDFKTSGTCARVISFDLEEGNIIRNVTFQGGCNGNLKALSRVCEGKTAEEIAELFSGITCNGKSTSCSDQLARAMRAVCEMAEEKTSVGASALEPFARHLEGYLMRIEGKNSYSYDNSDDDRASDYSSSSSFVRYHEIEALKKEMRHASALLEFEHAAYLRDRIRELEEQ